MVKKIVFNARNVYYGSGGTARWSEEVLRMLMSNENCEVRVIAPRNSFFGNGWKAYFWEQLIVPFIVRKDELLFSPSNLGTILYKSQAVVIHDLLPLNGDKDFSKIYQFALRVIYKPLFMRVQTLFTVSDGVRDQIIQLYPSVELKISVIGGGIREDTNYAIQKIFKDLNFCLIVGSHIRRKNLNFLLDIWSEVYRNTGCRLISTSRTVRDNVLTLHGSSDSHGPIWYTNIADLTDENLNSYYLNAKFVLQPSTGEGFGLPLLEGMNLGTPFISNNVGIARDISVGRSRVFPLIASIWTDYLVNELKDSKDVEDSEIQRFEARKHTWGCVVDKILMAFD